MLEITYEWTNQMVSKKKISWAETMNGGRKIETEAGL